MELLFWQGLSVFFYLLGWVWTLVSLGAVVLPPDERISPRIRVFLALIWPLTWAIIIYQTVRLVKKSREVRHARFFA